MLDAISQRNANNVHYEASPNFTRRLILSRSDVLVGVLLLGVMLLGGFFRFQANNWDDMVHFHPDERFLTANVASNLGRGHLAFTDMDDAEKAAEMAYCRGRNPDTNGVGGYFDTRCSDMNPHNIDQGFYAYGTLPPFAARWTALLLNQVTGTTNWTGYAEIVLLWRGMSALYDTIAILAVFFTGLKIHGKWVGLVAAALYACAVLPIQIAHFATADGMTTMWIAISMLFTVRAHADGNWLNYGLAGAAFGAALASRFNIFPFVVVIIAVSGLRMLPIFDARLAWSERQRVLTAEFGGLVLAGILTFLIFRIFNPYAFQGPGFFGIIPNGRWLEDLASARHGTSIDAESPPHWQWVGRPTYLFAWWNMVMWGMGLAFGLTGWLAFVWSGWRLLRGREGAVKNLPFFLWLLIYFGWVGANFVMSMRYYLVLYPALAVLAGWALVEIVRRAFAHRNRVAGRSGRGSVPQKILAVGALVGVVGYTVLWAAMFSNIYRHLSTFTQASAWIWENLPADFSMQMDGTTTDEVPLINIPLANRNAGEYGLSKSTMLDPSFPQRILFVAPANGTVSSIHAPSIGALAPGQASPTTLRLAILNEDGSQVLAETTLTDIFAYDEDSVGKAYDIPLSSPLQLREGGRYVFSVEIQRGQGVATGGTIMANDGAWDEPRPPDICALPFGVSVADDPPPGLSSPGECVSRAALRDQIIGVDLELYADDNDFKRQAMIRKLTGADSIIILTNRRYDSNSRIPARWPMTNRYFDALFSGELGFDLVRTFEETFELGPLRVSDQYLPTYEALGIPKWLNEFEAEEAFHVYDHPAVFIFKKRDDFSVEKLREILYSVPLNQPGSMVDRYNDTTLAGQFYWSTKQSDAAPTRLEFSKDMQAIQSQGGTWSERFDRDSIINTTQIVGVVVWWLTMTLFGLVVWPLLFVAFPGLSDRGYGFAKFTGMFVISWLCWFPASVLRVPLWSPEGVRLMTLALAVISLLVALRKRAKIVQYVRENARLLLTIEALWAFMFMIFILVRMTNPDLWTTGFGGEKPMNFAYFNGILRSTIFPPIDPWYAGGFINYYYYGYVIVGVPTLFTQTIPSFAYNLILPTLFASIGLGAFSAAYSLVEAWKVRNFTPTPTPRTQEGGESASSQIGGQNTLDQQMAYVQVGESNLTASSFSTSESESHDGGFSGQSAGQSTSHADNSAPLRLRGGDGGGVMRLGNPYLAGIAALLLAVVLGNLDTPRVFLTGVEDLGREGQAKVGENLFDFLVDEYTQENGTPPDSTTLSTLRERADANNTSDWLRYEIAFRTSQLRNLSSGMSLLLQGSTPPIGTDRWFWGPSRVIGEGLGGDPSISEFPYFTFVYGDLHAHMISMPMMLLVLVFVFNELILAGRERRTFAARVLALFLGGLTAGMFQAVNTWDWPTFTLFGVLGLGYAWWLSWRRITRRSLVAMFFFVGGFVVVNFFVKMPYALWFATEYSSISLWDGRKTALWMYFQHWGLFLFLLFTLLLWETARWLRTAHVRALRGRMMWITIGLGVFAVTMAAAIIAAISDYQVALIVLPLVVWIAVLFFRPGQSIPMQFALVLAGLALCITLGVEVIVLAGDNGRQNTVFKFYIQVWLLLSVACGAGFAWLVRSSDDWRTWQRNVWYIPLALLVFAAALYPVTATAAKSVFRMASDIPPTLDGADFMKYAKSYWQTSFTELSNPVDIQADYAVINWLEDNVQGTPHIIEAVTKDVLYTWGGRISIQTGLPSVVGWDHHQRQQRSIFPLTELVNQRVANTNGFYTTTDLNAAWRVLETFDVDYIIVAGLERARYSDTGGLAKFDEMVARGWLEVAFETPFQMVEVFPPQTPDMARVYRVVRGSNPGAFVAADELIITSD